MARSKLTDTQLVILSAAAQHEDLLVMMPQRLRGGAAKSALANLLKKGLIEPIQEEVRPHGVVVAEIDGATEYRISAEGLAALGVRIDPAETDDPESQTTAPEEDREHYLKPYEAGPSQPADPIDPMLTESFTQTMVPEFIETPTCEGAPQSLMSKLNGSAPAQDDALPSALLPRSGTKLAEVIALLQRSEGARLDELTAATGWLPHTTRAALTGLRKRGMAVTRGKNDSGVSVYRLAAQSSLDNTPQDAPASNEAA